jgi:hypothetical protein
MAQEETVSARRPCIVVAVEPRVYREVLAAALQTARPALRVFVSEAQHLDEVIAAHQPDLVLVGLGAHQELTFERLVAAIDEALKYPKKGMQTYPIFAM